MSATNPLTTPIASSKTAALTRVLDCVPKGYIYYTEGSCEEGKAIALARKFHALYGIACSPAQRITRKSKGEANAILVMYYPGFNKGVPHPEFDQNPVEGNPKVHWLLIATEGKGPIHEQEKLRLVTRKPYLVFLGYELVRQPHRGSTKWTFRRTKAEMEELYNLLSAQLKTKRDQALAETLLRISRQPGFSGVRQQSFELIAFAKSKGFTGETPKLFFVQKISHGTPVVVG